MSVPRGIITNYQKKKFENITKSKSHRIEILNKIEERKKVNHKSKIKTEFWLFKYVVIDSYKIESITTTIDSEYEQNILTYGFKNPILIKSEKNKIIHVDLGLMDLTIAKKNNLLIPAIILDYENMFPESFEITNELTLKNLVDKRDFDVINKFENIKIQINNEITKPKIKDKIIEEEIPVIEIEKQDIVENPKIKKPEQKTQKIEAKQITEKIEEIKIKIDKSLSFHNKESKSKLKYATKRDMP